MTTLDTLLDEAIDHRWRGMRSAPNNRSQAQSGIATLQVLLGWNIHGQDVRVEDIRRAVQVWLSEGLAASTINYRLNCLSAIGLDVKGARLPVKQKLKWFLTDEAAAELVPLLRSARPTDGPYRVFFPALADMVEWTVQVGTRVEETLRLRWSDFTLNTKPTPAGDIPAARVRVPGSKTSTAQKTLPLGDQAAALVHRMAAERVARGSDGVRDPALFIGIDYAQAQRAWTEARLLLTDLPDPKVATLRTFRRSAARNLHAVKGMPLDMVRQYLRHERVETTMGYLRLTGGYGEEEMRRWL